VAVKADAGKATSSQPPAATATPAPTATKAQGNLWRASELKGLNVYNEQNEKLGDISEIIIGVGGFLGTGQHDIKVEMSKLKFVDKPVRTSSTSANTGTTGANTRATTTTSSTANSANDHKWYPDHAILSGASKEQLKSMPQFKFD